MGDVVSNVSAKVSCQYRAERELPCEIVDEAPDMIHLV